MKNNNIARGFRAKALSGAVAICLWALVPAQGAVFYSINPASTSAMAGSSGIAFDVLLNNTGVASLGVAGFSFMLTASSSDIIFTSATTAAAGYIFAGNSFANDFFSGDLSAVPVTGQTVTASDITSNGAMVTVSAANSVGVGRIFFSVAPGAPTGGVSITISTGPASSLSDSSGNSIPLDTPSNGTVIVTAGEIPEPATSLLLLLTLPALACLRKRT